MLSKTAKTISRRLKKELMSSLDLRIGIERVLKRSPRSPRATSVTPSKPKTKYCINTIKDSEFSTLVQFVVVITVVVSDMFKAVFFEGCFSGIKNFFFMRACDVSALGVALCAFGFFLKKIFLEGIKVLSLIS